MKRRLEILGLMVGIVMALATAAAAFIVLPYRVTIAEQDIQRLKIDQRKGENLLIRLDERIQSIQQRLGIDPIKNK